MKPRKSSIMIENIPKPESERWRAAEKKTDADDFAQKVLKKKRAAEREAGDALADVYRLIPALPENTVLTARGELAENKNIPPVDEDKQALNSSESAMRPRNRARKVTASIFATEVSPFSGTSANEVDVKTREYRHITRPGSSLSAENVLFAESAVVPLHKEAADMPRVSAKNAAPYAMPEREHPKKTETMAARAEAAVYTPFPSGTVPHTGINPRTSHERRPPPTRPLPYTPPGVPSALTLNYSFRRWQGDHSVQISLHGNSRQEKQTTLLPSGTYVADALSANMDRLAGKSPEILPSLSWDDERQKQDPPHFQDEEQP